MCYGGSPAVGSPGCDQVTVPECGGLDDIGNVLDACGGQSIQIAPDPCKVGIEDGHGCTAVEEIVPSRRRSGSSTTPQRLQGHKTPEAPSARVLSCKYSCTDRTHFR